MTTEIVLEGTVVDLSWRNPHAEMTFEVASDGGATFRQAVELASVSEIRGLGVERDQIPVGARVGNEPRSACARTFRSRCEV